MTRQAAEACIARDYFNNATYLLLTSYDSVILLCHSPNNYLQDAYQPSVCTASASSFFYTVTSDLDYKAAK